MKRHKHIFVQVPASGRIRRGPVRLSTNPDMVMVTFACKCGKVKEEWERKR